jgi:hypothetical protein
LTIPNGLEEVVYLENFRGLWEFLGWKDRKRFALYFCELIMNKERFINIPDQIHKGLDFVAAPLILDHPSAGTEDYADIREISYELDTLMRSLFFFSSEDHREEFEVGPIYQQPTHHIFVLCSNFPYTQILQAMAKLFAQGVRSMSYTLPYLFTRALALAIHQKRKASNNLMI